MTPGPLSSCRSEPMVRHGRLLLPLALAGAALLAATASPAAPAGVGPPAELSEKEAFMLMFGKGNGAMRVLCALERDGLIDQAQRRRYAARLESLLTEAGDSASDHRNVRIGMAFADARGSVCPERLLPRSGS